MNMDRHTLEQLRDKTGELLRFGSPGCIGQANDIMLGNFQNLLFFALNLTEPKPKPKHTIADNYPAGGIPEPCIYCVDFEKLEEKNETLQAQLTEWTEKEATCCPEDVGFEEYIKALQARIGELGQGVIERDSIIGRHKHRIDGLEKEVAHQVDMAAQAHTACVGLQTKIKLLKQCDDSSAKVIEKMDSEIKQLQAQLDKYRWIPVNEGLPKKGQSVLILTSYGLQTTAKFRNDLFIRLLSCRRCDGLSIGSVTRWMEIPNI